MDDYLQAQVVVILLNASSTGQMPSKCNVLKIQKVH